ncbi:hypothetical protein Tco_0609935 [Tanacetum coccineum]
MLTPVFVITNSNGRGLEPSVQSQSKGKPKNSMTLSRRRLIGCEKLLDAGIDLPSLTDTLESFNEDTRKDHFPLAFNGPNARERLARKTNTTCLLDGFSGYFQFPMTEGSREDYIQHAHTESLPIAALPFGLATLRTFQRSELRNWGSPREKKKQAFPTIHYASKSLSMSHEAQKTHLHYYQKDLLCRSDMPLRIQSYLVMSKSIGILDLLPIKYIFAKEGC